MKAFANVNARSVKDAVAALQGASREKQRAVPTGGGSDLLVLVKERLVAPDVLVNLKTIGGLDGVSDGGSQGVRIGGLITLAAVSREPLIRDRYAVLAEAAGSVGTPQIRNVGTLAGNVCQRPWCWYFRNGFPCYKNGGDRCFARGGENQFHSIFGAGPSYIVHPSDAAVALMALDASFRIAAPSGDRTLKASEFFVLPKDRPERENVLKDDEVLTEVLLPQQPASVRGTYHKVLDREAWTHAVVSAAIVLDMDGDTCRSARIALGGVAPIPWRVPAAERLLAGKRITPDLAAQAAAAAVEGARPLTQNGYKVPLTKNVVRRTLIELSQRPA